jgi:hypothetical protein
MPLALPIPSVEGAGTGSQPVLYAPDDAARVEPRWAYRTAVGTPASHVFTMLVVAGATVASTQLEPVTGSGGGR